MQVSMDFMIYMQETITGLKHLKLSIVWERSSEKHMLRVIKMQLRDPQKLKFN